MIIRHKNYIMKDKQLQTNNHGTIKRIRVYMSLGYFAALKIMI